MRQFTTIILSAGFFAIISCNSEKRALRHIHKAERINRPTVNKYFADRYNITDSTDVRVIFKEGQTIYDTVVNTEIEFINDTVYVKEIKKVTVNKTDTIDRSQYERKQNNALIAKMQDIQDGLNQALHECGTEKELYKAEAKRLKKNNTTLGIIIACYIAFKILMLWLSAKFPANKIVNVVRKVF